MSADRPNTPHDDGGPAFPVTPPATVEHPGHYYITPVAHQGMTLRDYFAAFAMSARMQLGGLEETIADDAYAQADAMLKARNA